MNNIAERMLFILLITAHIVYFADKTACCCSIIVFFFALVGVVNKGIHKGIDVDITMNGKIGSVPCVVGVSMTYVQACI